MHPKLIFTGDFPILTCHVDSNRKATVPALIQLMQEAAMQNVIEINLSLWDLEEKGISWVVMRMNLHINRLPELGEVINIKTHGAGFQKIFTYRDYHVTDQNGNVIAYAPSTWILMDTNSRKMVRIPDDILEYKTPPPEQCLPRISHKLPAFNEVENSLSFQVGWHDLDFNQHLNNVHYIQWMLETVDENLLASGQLEELDILYKAEAHYKDVIISESHRLDDRTYMHRLLRESDKKEISIAKTVWK